MATEIFTSVFYNIRMYPAINKLYFVPGYRLQRISASSELETTDLSVIAFRAHSREARICFFLSFLLSEAFPPPPTPLLREFLGNNDRGLIIVCSGQRWLRISRGFVGPREETRKARASNYHSQIWFGTRAGIHCLVPSVTSANHALPS